ncbi:MAG: rRNA pseudouridine synthase [Candidatus Obscuribacterales bacterium]|nr:rRNA pseudouridine synthase [Candidatus Obscuribacterales bacterium]
MRLNQAVAKTGICSRRQADELIASGQVQVNGKVVTDFSLQFDPERDNLTIGSKELTIRANVYLALHKPPGIVCTRADEQGRETVLDLLPPKFSHLRPVGRLDMYSEGLLLLTNDGLLTQRVTHPVHHLPKTYRVKIKGEIKDQHLKQMASGVILDDGPTRPAKVKLCQRNKTYSEFEISLKEGRNRQIRRMCEHLGYPIIQLLRLSIGGLQLGEMTIGTWRYLTDAEVKLLLSSGPSRD